MRGLIPSAILILGLGSRLFLGEGAWDIRQIVDRVAIVHMIGDAAGGCCGADGPNIARTLRRDLELWQVTQRRSRSARRHDLSARQVRLVCRQLGRRLTVELQQERLPGRQDRGLGIPRETNLRVACGLLRR